MKKGLLNIFLDLKIRIKLIVIIGVIIILVVSTLSWIGLSNQRNQIEQDLDSLCRLSLENLNSISRENLLLKQIPPIQEHINSFSKTKVSGFNFAYVADRDGRIVSHSNLAKINQIIPGSEWNRLLSLNDVQKYETSEYFDYVRPVIVTHSKDGAVKNIKIGIARINFNRSVVNEPVRKTERTILMIAILVAAISIIGVYFISGKLVEVILKLSEGAKRVGAGDYTIKVEITLRDELGSLASEFNSMVKNIRETFKFISEDTFQKIKETESMTLGGEKKIIGLFFSDIRGFTAMSEKLEPEQVVEVINEYLDIQTQILKRHEGNVDKYVGDEIMCRFDGTEMADRMVAASIEIIEAITEMNRKRETDGQVAVKIGIGLNIGPAVVGSMGSRTRMDYTAIGDAVNLAARLCGAAKPLQILATDSIVKPLKQKYKINKLEPIMVKGKKDPIPVYEILTQLEK